VIWLDIVVLHNSQDAAHAVDVLVANISTASEAAEIIGAARAREISPGDWHAPVAADHLEAWRERVAKLAMLRWEAAARERLIEDEILDASQRLAERARRSGVRLGRQPRDVIRDRLIGTRRDPFGGVS
jgi:hypothetical protein